MQTDLLLDGRVLMLALLLELLLQRLCVLCAHRGWDGRAGRRACGGGDACVQGSQRLLLLSLVRCAGGGLHGALCTARVRVVVRGKAAIILDHSWLASENAYVSERGHFYVTLGSGPKPKASP